MTTNISLNDYAATLRELLSEARKRIAVSAEGTAELTQVILTLSILATSSEPLPETIKLAERVTENIPEEIEHCIALGVDCNLPIQWCPPTSFGLDLFQAMTHLAIAELTARRSGLDLHLDFLDVTVESFCVDTQEIESKTFDVLDEPREMLAYVQGRKDKAQQNVRR